jgi:hypothetical protein
MSTVEPDEDGLEPDWEPGRWWQVINPAGQLWCETSSESEARAAVRPGDTLRRMYVRSESKWVNQ